MDPRERSSFAQMFTAILVPVVSPRDCTTPLLDLLQGPTGCALESLPIISVPSIDAFLPVFSVGTRISESRWFVARSELQKLVKLSDAELESTAVRWARHTSWGAAPAEESGINWFDLLGFLHWTIDFERGYPSAEFIVLDLEAQD